MSFDLRTLRSFVSIASTGSISAAAEIQHIAQPALSVQIRQLEEQLGATLFERHPRGVKLTAAGERLLEHVIEILRRVDIAYEDVRNAINEPSGPVSIALPQSVAKFITVPLVREVVEKWPKINLQLIEMSTGYIPDQILRGLVDIGITFGIEEDIRLQFTHLMDEELVLVMSKQQQSSLLGSSIKRDQAIILQDIQSLPVILPTTTHSLRRRINEYLAKEKILLNIIAEVNAIPDLIALAKAGIGATILSFAAVKEYVKSRQLVAISINHPKITRSIYSCRSGILPMSIAATKTHEQLHKTIDDLLVNGDWPTTVSEYKK